MGALEGIYRSGLVDFYKTEWELLNDSLDKVHLKKRDKPIIHVFGDSFTATPLAWLTDLRSEFPETVFVNHAVPGTGIRQALIIARSRLSNNESADILYQIYVGNDLTDIRHITNSQSISATRKIYWEVGNRFLFPSFVNYRMGQFYAFRKYKSRMESKPLAEDTLKHEKFPSHELQLIASEPDFILNSVLLQNGREKDMKELVSGLKKLIKYQKPTARMYLLVVPHCTQVDIHYRNDYEKRGVKFPADSLFYQNNYPFIAALESEFSQFPTVKILNPLPALKEAEAQSRERVYKTNDIHLNTLGNKIIYQIIKKKINPY